MINGKKQSLLEYEVPKQDFMILEMFSQEKDSHLYGLKYLFIFEFGENKTIILVRRLPNQQLGPRAKLQYQDQRYIGLKESCGDHLSGRKFLH